VRLADFILANIEPILSEWEAYARTIWPPEVQSDPASLRDHAEEMLRATALDIQSDQTATQQTEKSKGKGDVSTHSTDMDQASSLHGWGRHGTKFGLAALISEYRALRASVLRLWRESLPIPDIDDLADLTRFGESIDQSLTAAVLAFTKRVEAVLREREQLLAAELAAATRMQQVSTRLIQAEDFSLLLHEILDVAIEITDADMGNIQLLEGGTLKILAQRGFEAPFLDFFDSIHSGQAACGTAMQSGKRVIVEDVTASPVFAGQTLDVMLKANARAVQSTPLVNRSGRTLGMFSTHYHAPHLPSERSLRLLDVMARQVADLIEHRQVEEVLRNAKEQAEAASQAKDKFLAVLSHELRTPLSPVLMLATALGGREDLPPDLHDDLIMIRRNIELQSRLIDDLLDLSRITTGKLRLSFEVLDFNDLVRRACETCRPNLREKGIQLYCDLDAEVFDVVGDGGRLQQVIWNLLNNATKFTPEGGKVYVHTENSVGPGDRQVRVTVRDTGMGIAFEALPRIFHAFEQAEQGEFGMARQFGGMGLGLAICDALVKHHRGAISAHSEGKDTGSTFVVELPAVSHQDYTDGASDPSAQELFRPLHLLLVEDHTDTAKILSRLLSQGGHNVKTAMTGADALRLAKETSFDLMISDLGLPDMTGYELMQRIQQDCGIQGIAMSGYGMEEDIKKSKLAGFSDHLIKPVNVEQLEQAIRRVTVNGFSRRE
jgi:signal transduction histidine kinase/ActR/RegA family two-component response regulator